MLAKEPKYISLREAAQISGYSADYLGQLIRAGKITGKQVFSNVAWMTTEEAIHTYLQKDHKSERVVRTWADVREAVMSVQGLSHLYRYFLTGAIVILCLFVLSLMYILAVSIDHSIEARYLETVNYER